MANYNLTNQAIEDSFQPLLQIDSGSALRDGSGSLVDNIIVTSSYALTASFAENAVPQDTGSLLTTASFDNGTRDLTFTKGDSSTFSVNIPDVSGSVLPSGVISGSSQVDYPQISNIPSGIVSSSAQVSDLTASLLETASVVDATITFTKGDGTTFDITVDNVLNSTYSQNTITTGKNLEGAPIIKGSPLFFTGSGTSGNLVGIYYADAGNPDRMPAGGIAGETIAPGAEGIVLLDGYIEGVDTSQFASGDMVYVGVGGGYTNVPPTGSAQIQFLGNVEKSGVNGSGVIQMMGEARGLPNIQQGYAWVGDGNGVPQAVATSSFAVSIDTGSFATTGSNTFNGNQSINGILGVTMENEFDESFIGVSGSAGKTPRVNYTFTEYSPGDWDYRQTFTDVEFAYFRNDGGGMLFTSPNNDIKFVSPTTNIWSQNLIIKDEIGGLPTSVILSGSLNMNGNQLVTGLFGLVGNPNTTFDIFSNGGNFDTFKVQVTQNNGSRIVDWDGSSDQTWLTIPTNTGSNPKPIFNRGLAINNELDVNGNINLPYDGTQRLINVGVSGSDAYNIGGFDFDGKAYGSINSFATGGFQITNDATDSASSLNLRSNNGNINLTSNGFIINTINTDTIWRAQQSQYRATLYGGGFSVEPTPGYTGSAFNATIDTTYGMNIYNSSFTQDTGFTLDLNGVTSSGRNKIGFYSNYGGPGVQDLISFQDATNYTDGAIEFHQVVSGSSVTLSDTLTLTPVDPLPAGVVGNLAVSGSALYFYDGVWKQVSLV